jgi:hypothetical protein
MVVPPNWNSGLRYHQEAIAPGAQTERPGEAGPVGASLGGKNLTGALIVLTITGVEPRRAAAVVRAGDQDWGSP